MMEGSNRQYSGCLSTLVSGNAAVSTDTRNRPVSPCITTMVPYHRPIPERKSRDGKDSAGGGMFNAWVQAEKLMQIAMMLPSAGFIGWLAGYGLDRWLHQTWIGTAGAIFGIIAGLVAAVRMAIAYSADPASNSKIEKSDENGNHNDAEDSGKTS